MNTFFFIIIVQFAELFNQFILHHLLFDSNISSSCLNSLDDFLYISLNRENLDYLFSSYI